MTQHDTTTVPIKFCELTINLWYMCSLIRSTGQSMDGLMCLHKLFGGFDLDFHYTALVTAIKMKAGSEHYTACLVFRAGSVWKWKIISMWKWKINWLACLASFQPFEERMIFLIFLLLWDGYIIFSFFFQCRHAFILFDGTTLEPLTSYLSDVPFLQVKKGYSDVSYHTNVLFLFPKKASEHLTQSKTSQAVSVLFPCWLS